MKIKDMLDKKMKEKQNSQKVKMVKNVTAGAMAGVAAGIVGGVLLAPKSGKEIRNGFAKTPKDLGESAITKTAEIIENLDNRVFETKINVAPEKEKIGKHLAGIKTKRSNSKNQDKVDKVIGKVKEAARKTTSSEEMDLNGRLQSQEVDLKDKFNMSKEKIVKKINDTLDKKEKDKEN